MYEEEYFKERNPELEQRHVIEVAQCISFMGLQEHDKILDYGCGFGQHVHCFVEEGIQDVVGFDISEYAKQHPFGKSENRLTTSLSEISSKYDLIFSIDILEHLTDEQVKEALAWIRKHTDKLLVGITSKDSPNFVKDKTHINGKTIYEWKHVLKHYFRRVNKAPKYFHEAQMYLIAYAF